LIKSTVILLFIYTVAFTIFPASDFFGYYENRFFLIFNTGSVETGSGDVFTGDYNRLRLMLKASPAEKVKVNVAVDFFSIYGSVISPTGVAGDTAEESSGPYEQISLDRVYADIYFKHFDLSVGKQRIAMGVSYLWAPLDIFNRVNFLEPKEEKPGVNALKVYVPIGNNKALTAVFFPEDDLGGSGKALKFKWTFWNIDAGFTYIRDYSIYNEVLGLDLRGENLIGWWIEFGSFNTLSAKYGKLVLGMDYTFPVGQGLYWMNEYLYDGSGEPEPALYEYEILKEGTRFTLGRNYLMSMLRYGFSEFASLSVSYIGNLDDGSFILNPALSYEMFNNVTVTSGFYLPMGKGFGELNRAKIGAFFLWLKINF